MTRRRRAIAAGVAVTALYAASAALSGHLSPLARRPLLDGLAPPTAYRWVEPPPELAGTNRRPTPGSFEVGLGSSGSRTAVFTTDDAQVTLILPKGSFSGASGQRSVEITVEPTGPSEVHAPESPLLFVGNVYRVGATYGPSGDPAPLTGAASVVLVYPLLSNDHGGHSVIWSRSGKQWKEMQTDDLPSIQQASGDIDGLGYVAVAGTPPSPTAGIGQGESGSSVVTIAIAVGLAVLSVVAALLLRGSRRSANRDGARSRR